MRLTAFRPIQAPMALAAIAVLALSMPAPALGQADPFGALYTPAPGAAPAKDASSGRTGATSVSGAVGRSYAGADASGRVSLAQLDMMPDNAPPLPVALQGHATRYLANRPKIVIPGYTLAFVQGASASAFCSASLSGRRAMRSGLSVVRRSPSSCSASSSRLPSTKPLSIQARSRRASELPISGPGYMPRPARSRPLTGNGGTTVPASARAVSASRA